MAQGQGPARDQKVRVLGHYQVCDAHRGASGFFLGLERTKQRYKGQPIYTDRYGRRLVIEGAG